MKIEQAKSCYQRFQKPIDANMMKVNQAICGVACGVGASTVRAVYVMLGYPSGVRKTFVGPVRKFLQRYPGFQIADAQDVDGFAARNPGFKLPNFNAETPRRGEMVNA